MICVEIINDNKRIFAPCGSVLSEVMRSNGYTVHSYCGGRGQCGKCLVKVDGETTLACRYVLAKDVSVELLAQSKGVYSPSGISLSEHFEGSRGDVAVDIGTTSISVCLLDTAGNAVDILTVANPQRVYGSDIISRISAANVGKLVELQGLVVGAIDKAINDLMHKYAVPQLRKVYVAGNTIMLHLFLGVDPSSIGFAPYTPVFLAAQSADALSLGFSFSAEVETLPNASAFVGSDIVAGLLYLDAPTDPKYNLLIDLGTNAETVLFNNTEYVGTTSAAGPCFEGANISSGMCASVGAIKHITIHDTHADIEYSGDKPLGICGSGIIDAMAELYTKGYIDESGAFIKGDLYRITDDIAITQKDVREFQLAKSAVRSGIEVLLSKRGIGYDDIEHVFIAGGFSTSISVASCAACGLLPPRLVEKTLPVQNSCLKGLIKYAKQHDDCSHIINHFTYVDLSADTAFVDEFMQYIGF